VALEAAWTCVMLFKYQNEKREDKEQYP